MGEMWPEEFDPTWARDQASATRSALTKLTQKWDEDGVIMSQDFFQRGGVIDESMTRDPYADPDDEPKTGQGADNWKGWTATDSNTLGKLSERMFGEFDPATGEWIIMDRTVKQRVQSVQTEAEQIYVRARNAGNTEMTHAKALTQAARKANIEINDLSDEGVNNPLNLVRPGQQ
jgi:hypothetical protein